MVGETHRNLRLGHDQVYEHYGSVEGIIEKVSVMEGKMRFRLQVRVFDRSVRCRMPPDLVDGVVHALGRRVTVTGRVRTNARGDVLSIWAEDVEAFPADEELPTIDQVAGAFDLMCGKSIRDHLDALRSDSRKERTSDPRTARHGGVRQ